MDVAGVKSIPIVVGREDDGRWWADVESMPGAMACGATRDCAIAAVRALAWRVAAGRWLYYRRPAFLSSTDLNSSAKPLYQICFDRWQREVNHRAWQPAGP